MRKKVYIFILLSFSMTIQVSFGQEIDPFIQSMVDSVSYDTLHSTLQTLENLGVKEIGTESLDNTAQWLINKYESYGYSDIQLDHFMYAGSDTYNIIVTKQGFLYPDQYLIIDGHYDTRTGPGVNDNGSGVAIILEIARLLRNVETAWSVKFINFSCEENGLVGSYNYVNNVVIPQNLNIKLVFNIDEVGGVAGAINDQVVCERDESSPTYNNDASSAYTDTLAYLTDTYSNLTHTISFAYGSDYVPFQTNGEIVTGLFEYNYSPYHHTLYDSLVNLDMTYVYEIAKTSVAGGLYFSGAVNPSTSAVYTFLNNKNICVYPNPFSDRLFLKLPDYSGNFLLKISDAKGLTVAEIPVKSNQGVIQTADFLPGIYFYQLQNTDGSPVSAGKIMKIK